MYKQTPEREERINQAFRLHDAARSPGRPADICAEALALMAIFAEEDEIEARYGECRPVDWVFTDPGSGDVQVIRSVKTSIEALARAFTIWMAMGIRPDAAGLKIERRDGKNR